MKIAASRRRRAPGPGGWIALALLLLIAVTAIVAPVAWGQAASVVDTSAISQGPSAEHWLGTDGSGRDVLSRTLVATQLSVFLAVVATILGAMIGLVFGALPAALGPRVEAVSGTVISTWLAFPALMLALLITIMLGPGIWTGVLAIALTVAPMFARLMQTLSGEVARTDYVAAARMLGIRGPRLLTRYIAPNVAEPVVVYVLTSMSGALLALASLSFLGLGVQPPAYDWGRMLADGLATIYTNPWSALGPGIAIVVTGIAFALSGDALARLLAVDGSSRRSVVLDTFSPALPVANAPAAAEGATSLVVEHLSVSFPTESGPLPVVVDVSLALRSGEVVGLVGESGSGKSVTARALASLIEPPGDSRYERLSVAGVDLSELGARERATHLRRHIGFVFQDPSASLNPGLTVGRQLVEAVDAAVARRRGLRPYDVAIDQLARLQIPDPAKLMRQYPAQLSGGMRQRVLVAMARMNEPTVLIADEPTTALDVTVQQHFLAEIAAIARDDGVAVLVVSHDLGALAQIADRIVVMYAGSLVEEIGTTQLLEGRAEHPYTRGLYEAVPSLTQERSAPLSSIPGTPPPPSEIAVLTECAFLSRCSKASEMCQERPLLRVREAGNRLACHHPVTTEDSVAIGADS